MYTNGKLCGSVLVVGKFLILLLFLLCINASVAESGFGNIGVIDMYSQDGGSR